MTDSDDNKERWSGRLALMVAHCAGMVDLVALPVWIGALISRYGLAPQAAGTLVTLFLLGAVASSLLCARLFQRLHTRAVAASGFAVSALAFFAMTFTADYALMAVLHLVAGVAAGSALSVTHGTAGLSRNPHRMFALCGMALGLFAIGFLGALPGIVTRGGGTALFSALAIVMLVAALTSAVAFPRPARRVHTASDGQQLGSSVWFAALGIACMGLVQAMLFSFLERIGADRGYSATAITGVLIALGVVNLFPAPLAALLERRWPARLVVLAGPVLQATVALTITQGGSFVTYAGGGAVFAAIMIFTHTFAFGLVAQLDPGGRALTATPAMLMTGAAIGPVLGGTLVQHAGYPMLGSAAVIIAAFAVTCFARAGRRQLAPA